MPTNILVPALGESVVEATVGKWLKLEGDAVFAYVRADKISRSETLLELVAGGGESLASLSR